MRRAARLIPIVVAATLAAPAAALAHASLVDTQPAERAVLARAPARVVVRFDDDVPGRAGKRGGSKRRRLGARAAGRARTAAGSLPLRDELANGDYSVRWSAVSDDGHIVQGVLAFASGPAGRRPRRRSASRTRSASARCSARWVFFAGLLVGSGLALFDLLVWRPIAGADIRTGWIALGLAAMFVSSHGLVRESHAGVATRSG